MGVSDILLYDDQLYFQNDYAQLYSLDEAQNQEWRLNDLVHIFGEAKLLLVFSLSIFPYF